MKAILTHQSAQYQGPDILIIDGNKGAYSGTMEQKEAQETVLKASRKEFQQRIPAFCKVGTVSNSLSVCITDANELVFTSNFINKDERGRNISFDFYCSDIDNPARVLRLFEDYCRIAEMKPNPSDCKTIERFLSYYKNKTVVNIGLIGFAAVILWLIIKIIF